MMVLDETYIRVGNLTQTLGEIEFGDSISALHGLFIHQE